MSRVITLLLPATTAILSVACGGSSSSPSSATAQQASAPASLIAMPADRDDVRVASVNGKPVYASCLTNQMKRGSTRQVALDDCIGFELLAQQAAAYATDPEVLLATRTEMVSAVIAREYEAAYNRPEEFGGYLERSIEANKLRLVHPEARASAYARIVVPANASPADDAAAHAIADEIADATVRERGLFATNLQDIAKRVVAGRAKLDSQPVSFYAEGMLDPAYAKALFAVPEVGRTTGPVRTPWGWDVILLTEILPAANPTPAEMAARALPDVKRGYFSVWLAQLAQRLGITVKYFDQNIPLLEKVE